MSSVPRASLAIAAAIERTMRSMDWMLAFNDEEARADMLLEALHEELHPLGPVQVPSVHMLHEAAGRHDRDAEILGEFDGHNYQTLARRHRLSTRQVRRIVERRRGQVSG